jgi:hypothetical protein
MFEAAESRKKTAAAPSPWGVRCITLAEHLSQRVRLYARAPSGGLKRLKFLAKEWIEVRVVVQPCGKFCTGKGYLADRRGIVQDFYALNGTEARGRSTACKAQLARAPTWGV